MNVTATSSALRQYQAAREQIGGSTNAAKPGSTTSKLAEGVQEFAKVFQNVEATTQGLADGTSDAQSVVQALANAEMALETAVTVRNRVVEAYQELLRMPI